MKNVLHKIVLLAFVIVLTGCVQPTIKSNSLLQYPTSKMRNLYVDVSGTDANSLANYWKDKVATEFNESTPKVFSEFGINAKVLELKNELSLVTASEEDYLLVINFTNGMTSSQGGSWATYSLDLFNLKTKSKIWTGALPIAWMGTMGTKHLGEGIARNVAQTMNSAKLFSDEIVRKSAAANAPTQTKVNLSSSTLAALEKFKTLKSPKAFVVADDGSYTFESGQTEGQEPPTVRALASCTAKYKNCRVLSDGNSIF